MKILQQTLPKGATMKNIYALMPPLMLVSVFLFFGCSDPKSCFELVKKEFPGSEIQNQTMSNDCVAGARFIIKDSQGEYWLVDTNISGTVINWRKKYPDAITEMELSGNPKPATFIIINFYDDKNIIAKKAVGFRPPNIGEIVIIGTKSYKVSTIEWKWEAGAQNVPFVNAYLTSDFKNLEKE